MKKIVILLFITLLSFSGIAVAGTDDPGKPVLLSFKNIFTGADQVSWNKAAEFFIATFIQNDKKQLAYFETNGKFIGKGEYISLDEVSIPAQLAILKRDATARINFIYQFTTADQSPTYYVRFQNPKKSWIDEVNSYGEIILLHKKKLPQSEIN